LAVADLESVENDLFAYIVIDFENTQPQLRNLVAGVERYRELTVRSLHTLNPHTAGSRKKRQGEETPSLSPPPALLSLVGLYPYRDDVALTSYEVLVDSKKFTNCKVSFAVAIHLAGFETLYSVSNPSSSRRRSARYFTYWLM
jgi:hypothetical protein